MTLDDVIASLSAIVKHPCYCGACKLRRQAAQAALLEAPGALKLMGMDQATSEFKVAEKEFREQELQRLSTVLLSIQLSKCEMKTTVEPPKPVIPDLPQDTPSDRMRHYADQLRKASIEMKKNPRIPGTFIIK